jgi:hypothetical protein
LDIEGEEEDGGRMLAVVVILMILTWRRMIEKLRDSSIYGSSIYLILYLPLVFPPILLVGIYGINFDFDDIK